MRTWVYTTDRYGREPAIRRAASADAMLAWWRAQLLAGEPEFAAAAAAQRAVIAGRGLEDVRDEEGVVWREVDALTAAGARRLPPGRSLRAAETLLHHCGSLETISATRDSSETQHVTRSQIARAHRAHVVACGVCSAAAARARAAQKGS